MAPVQKHNILPQSVPSFNCSCTGHGLFQSNYVNMIPADGLATQGARSSAAIILTLFGWSMIHICHTRCQAISRYDTYYVSSACLLYVSINSNNLCHLDKYEITWNADIHFHSKISTTRQCWEHMSRKVSIQSMSASITHEQEYLCVRVGILVETPFRNPTLHINLIACDRFLWPGLQMRACQREIIRATDPLSPTRGANISHAKTSRLDLASN